MVGLVKSGLRTVCAAGVDGEVHMVVLVFFHRENSSSLESTVTTVTARQPQPPTASHRWGFILTK